MIDLDNQTMTELSHDETAQIDGGFNWCAAFLIGGGAAFAAGLTAGAGTWVGAEVGAVASALVC